MVVQAPERISGIRSQEQVDQDLTQLVHSIEQRTVLGEDTTQDQRHAHGLLAEYGNIRGWGDSRRAEEQAYLESRMNDPAPKVYHHWLNTYANQAADSRKVHDGPAAEEAHQKAERCLAALAAARGWDESKYQSERTKLNTYIESGETERPRQKRTAKLAAGLGALSLAGIAAKLSASRYSKKQAAAKERTDQTSDEKKRRKKMLIAAGVVGVVAVGAVAAWYGHDLLNGHGHDAHDPLRDTLPKPKVPDHTSLPDINNVPSESPLQQPGGRSGNHSGLLSGFEPKQHVELNNGPTQELQELAAQRGVKLDGSESLKALDFVVKKTDNAQIYTNIPQYDMGNGYEGFSYPSHRAHLNPDVARAFHNWLEATGKLKTAS